MVERTRTLDIACHGLLILGGLLVCLPIYFAFVVGSHTVGDVLAVPPPWLPGDRFFENAVTAWQKGNLGRLLFNSLVVAFPLYLAFVASTHAAQEIVQAPMPLLPGTHFWENYTQVLFAGTTKGVTAPVGRMMFNSLVMALSIALGKIAISIIASFAIVDAVTKGGPGGATMILVYKVYQDGFVHIDLGSSAAQSVLLMIFAVILTMLQFRYIERNVNYDV